MRQTTLSGFLLRPANYTANIELFFINTNLLKNNLEFYFRKKNKQMPFFKFVKFCCSFSRKGTINKLLHFTFYGFLSFRLLSDNLQHLLCLSLLATNDHAIDYVQH